QRHPGDVQVDPHLALGGHLRSRGGQAGGTEVLQGDEQPAVEQLERALEQLLLLEGISHLDRRPAVLAAVPAVPELGGREHRGPADAVAAGRCAEQDDDVAGSRGGAADETLAPGEAQRHRVDEAVLLVGALEVDLASYGWNTDRVAVVRDAGDGAVEQVADAVAARGLDRKSTRLNSS